MLGLGTPAALRLYLADVWLPFCHPPSSQSHSGPTILCVLFFFSPTPGSSSVKARAAHVPACGIHALPCSVCWDPEWARPQAASPPLPPLSVFLTRVAGRGNVLFLCHVGLFKTQGIKEAAPYLMKLPSSAISLAGRRGRRIVCAGLLLSLLPRE